MEVLIAVHFPFFIYRLFTHVFARYPRYRDRSDVYVETDGRPILDLDATLITLWIRSALIFVIPQSASDCGKGNSQSFFVQQPACEKKPSRDSEFDGLSVSKCQLELSTTP